jgi:quercetin dioxygenase-like cupin family protein
LHARASASPSQEEEDLMNASTLATTLAVAMLSITGCAKPPQAQPVAQPEAPAAQPEAQPAPALGGPAARGVELLTVPGTGKPREVQVLVNEPALKLVTIALRGGTVLPEHQSLVPVTITAVEGSGTVITGGERFRIDAAHAVVLAPKVPHAVEPDAGTDLVLLVHHLGRAAESHQH